MALTLVLETGAGVSGANTFAALATGEAYAEAHVSGAAWTAKTDELKNASLAQATRMLCARLAWDGWMVDPEQALVWPRRGAYDADGNLIEDDTVPQQVVDATCELAIKLLVEDYSTDPTGGIKREKVDVLEIEYSDATARRRGPLPDVVLDMVYPLARLKSAGPHRVQRG